MAVQARWWSALAGALALLTVLAGGVTAPGVGAAPPPTHHVRGTLVIEQPGTGEYQLEVDDTQGHETFVPFDPAQPEFDLELPDGTYRIDLLGASNVVLGWYRDAHLDQDADLVTVAGSDVDLDPWRMPRLYPVQGRLLIDGTGGGMVVTAWPDGTAPAKPYYGEVDGSGVYRLKLPVGRWRLRFDDLTAAASPYHRQRTMQWYGDAAAASDAAVVTVTGSADPLQLAPERLRAGGSVTGHVTDATNGAPLRKVDVQVLDGDGHEVSTAVTRNDGSYDVPHVHPGPHTVRVLDADGDQYAVAAPGDVVPVLDQVAARGPDVALTPLPVPVGGPDDVTGTVTDQDGVPARGVQVTAWRSDCTRPDATAVTDVRGHFHMPAPGPGASYRLEFRDEYGVAEEESDDDFELVRAFWGGADCAGAGAVGPAAVADIALTRAGGLSGTVLDERGEAVLGASVSVERLLRTADGRPYVVLQSYRRPVDGSWSVGDLPPGQYRVHFGDVVDEYVPTYWPDVKTEAEATLVTVTSGAMTSGIAGHAFHHLHNLEPPVLSGDAVVGSTLSTSSGSWLGRVSGYTYTWRTAGTDDYRTVGSGTTYVVQPDDVGRRVSVLVSVTGPDGDSGRYTNASAPVRPVTSPDGPTAPPTSYPPTSYPPTSSPPTSPSTPSPTRPPTSSAPDGPVTVTAEVHPHGHATLVRVVTMRGSALLHDGTVTVTEHGHRLGSATVRRGVVRLLLRGLATGRHRVRVAYRPVDGPAVVRWVRFTVRARPAAG